MQNPSHNLSLRRKSNFQPVIRTRNNIRGQLLVKAAPATWTKKLRKRVLVTSHSLKHPRSNNRLQQLRSRNNSLRLYNLSRQLNRMRIHQSSQKSKRATVMLSTRAIAFRISNHNCWCWVMRSEMRLWSNRATLVTPKIILLMWIKTERVMRGSYNKWFKTCQQVLLTKKCSRSSFATNLCQKNKKILSKNTCSSVRCCCEDRIKESLKILHATS